VTRTRGEQNILPHWASDGGWTLSEVGTFGRPTSPRWSSAPGSQWDHATRSASK
jgi:hypothetical protein